MCARLAVITVENVIARPALDRECRRALAHTRIGFVREIGPPGVITVKRIVCFRILHIDAIARAVDLETVEAVFGFENIITRAVLRFLLNGGQMRVPELQGLHLLLGFLDMRRVLPIEFLQARLVLLFRELFIKEAE